MYARELTAGIFWLALGAAVTVVARGYEVGTLSHPGAGFLPFWLGLLLMVASLPVVARAVGGLRRREAAGPSPWAGVNLAKVGSTLACVLFFALMSDGLGYPLTSFLVLMAMLRIAGVRSKLVTVGTAALGAAVTWALFAWFLKADLPAGGWWG